MQPPSLVGWKPLHTPFGHEHLRAERQWDGDDGAERRRVAPQVDVGAERFARSDAHELVHRLAMQPADVPWRESVTLSCAHGPSDGSPASIHDDSR